jgi:hypothetical protein
VPARAASTATFTDGVPRALIGGPGNDTLDGVDGDNVEIEGCSSSRGRQL